MLKIENREFFLYKNWKRNIYLSVNKLNRAKYLNLGLTKLSFSNLTHLFTWVYLKILALLFITQNIGILRLLENKNNKYTKLIKESLV